MKLYFNPQSRATIAKWMLDEIGAQYETVPIDFEKKEHKAPAFLKINPAGKLPALVDGDVRLFENTAIALYLTEKFPDAGMAPKVGAPDRGRFLSWIVYSTSQLEPSMGDLLLKAPHHSSRGWTTYDECVRAVENELGGRPYLLGEKFSFADLMVGSMFIWKHRFQGASDGDTINAYVARLLARPAAAAVRG